MEILKDYLSTLSHSEVNPEMLTFVANIDMVAKKALKSPGGLD